jgi:hypothetical protein
MVAALAAAPLAAGSLVALRRHREHDGRGFLGGSDPLPVREPLDERSHGTLDEGHRP